MDLAEVEALSAAQFRYLDLVTDQTVFTADFLKSMHRDWLGGIYDWAGCYRTVEMSKGGFTWPPASRVADNMHRFEANILRQKSPFRHTDQPKLLRNLAVIHAEFLLIHPFREGNGRLGRWLVDLLCQQAGLQAPDYGFVGKGSRVRHRRYLDAVKRGYEQDYLPLETFFREALDRRTAG